MQRDASYLFKNRENSRFLMRNDDEFIFQNRSGITQVLFMYIWYTLGCCAKHFPSWHKFEKSGGPHAIGQYPRKSKFLWSNGAKHSPPGNTFHKSEGPSLGRLGSSEIKISEVNLYPDASLSILGVMIFDVDSKCVHPRF